MELDVQNFKEIRVKSGDWKIIYKQWKWGNNFHWNGEQEKKCQLKGWNTGTYSSITPM